MQIETNNLAPDHFLLWTPPAGRCLTVGPEERQVLLPVIPLPINLTAADEDPSDHLVGQGLYDYLRRFPDCPFNLQYAELLRDAFPHFLSDLAAHIVMLDVKDVEPAYVFRKLTALKILQLLEPGNVGLLEQLACGFYALALEFSELPKCHKHLLEAMRYGQDLLKIDSENISALNLLAEVDMLFCDYPGALSKWQRLQALIDDDEMSARIDQRLEKCQVFEMPERSLVEDLESVGEAMRLYSEKNFAKATFLLEKLEEDERFQSVFPSAEFFYLLGMCRIKMEDLPGAHVALHQALNIDPDHQLSQEALAGL